MLLQDEGRRQVEWRGQVQVQPTRLVNPLPTRNRVTVKNITLGRSDGRESTKGGMAAARPTEKVFPREDFSRRKNL